jgi:pimeloyl-ACP methyl ester carboxylesterase
LHYRTGFIILQPIAKCNQIAARSEESSMAKVETPGIVSETFGDPRDPALLLIMGAMASMLWWPEALCKKLAGEGRFVIRYDNRDTGLSTKYAPGTPPYTFDDMANDAISVLDSHGIAKAHVVGMSMGGMIAQRVALKHPSRVISLTVISSSPVGIDTSHLPGTTEAYMEHSADGAKVDWSDREQVIGFVVKDAQAIASTAHPFDEKAMRTFIERDYDRSGGFLSATNHFMLKGGENLKGRLHELNAPLLVIHGTADPIFPVEHGAALAEAVAGARLVRIEGGGHELHPGDWTKIAAPVVAHTKS